MEWFIAIIIVVPAIVLAFSQSSWLLDYTIMVVAFNRCIRRMVDFYFNGAFNPFSPISLTPLIVAALLLFPALVYFRTLSDKARMPFYLFAWAFIMSFAVGLVFNGFAAIYTLGEWLTGLAVMAFAAAQPVPPATADRWINTAGWAAVGVAAYGWWQYYTIPPWDAMWLVQSKMIGYMGYPEPTKMTMFSTMHERGPCGTFLAWVVIPMILNARWRKAGGWIAVFLLLSGIFLTATRSNFVLIASVVILYPILTKGRGAFNLVFLWMIVAIGINYGMNKIAGSEKMTERFGAESVYGKDSSLVSRIQIYRDGWLRIRASPLGSGMGSLGMGLRMKKSGQDESISDCGYVEVVSQFGWLGGVFFFRALWLIWKEIGVRYKAGRLLFGAGENDLFVPVTRALLLGSLIFLFTGNIFGGFSLLWLFFGRSLSPYTDPLLIARLRLAEPEPALAAA